MVGNINHRLFTFIPDKFHLILDRQNSLLILPAGGIPNPQLTEPGYPSSPSSLRYLNLIDFLLLPLSSSLTAAKDPLEDSLPPPLLAAVDRIRPVIPRELVVASPV